MQATAELSNHTLAHAAYRRPVGKSELNLKKGLDDESKPSLQPNIQPLSSINVSTKYRVQNFDRQLELELQNDIRTKGLEHGTKRTALLEDIANEMLENTGLNCRVVILNKGLAIEDHVYPDGTICITQAALNRLDYIDEVAALVAHEVEHLINKTFDKGVKAITGVQRMGVGWVHEMASDVLAPTLLEKAQYNSMAFSSAILKLSGSGRGIIHQGGLTRAAQTVGVHSGIDFETSSKPLEDIPSILHKDTQPTNFDLMFEAMKSRNTSFFLSEVGKLYARDIHNIQQTLFSDLQAGRSHPEAKKRKESNLKMIEATRGELIGRLKEKGYEKADIDAFLMLSTDAFAGRDAMIKIGNVQETLDLTDLIISLDKAKVIPTLSIDAFGQESSIHVPIEKFLQVLSNNMVNVDLEEFRSGIPIDRYSFVALSKKIWDATRPESHARTILTRTIIKFAEDNFLTIPRSSPIDSEQVKEFFQEFKDNGIDCKPETGIEYLESLDRSFVPSVSEHTKENRELVGEAYLSIFESIGEGEEGIRLTIDGFFQNMKGEEKVDDLFSRLSQVIERRGYSDIERTRIAEYISLKIDQLDDSNPYNKNIFEFLKIPPKSDSYYPDFTGKDLINNQLGRVHLKLLTAISIFSQDSDAFYDYLETAMKDSQFNLASLTRIQLVNLCQPLLQDIDMPFAAQENGRKHLLVYADNGNIPKRFNTFRITNIEQFSNLSFIQDILSKKGSIPTSWAELVSRSEEIIEGINTNIDTLGKQPNTFSLFSDSFVNVLLGEELRVGFIQLLDQDIAISDYHSLYTFLKNAFPEGAEKDAYLRRIGKAYLSSSEVKLGEKVVYLMQNFDKIGIEGAVLIAEQINTFAEYKSFRGLLGERIEKYYEGSEEMGKIASLDVITSIFTKHFESLLKTSVNSAQASTEASTALANLWFEHFSGDSLRRDIQYYDTSLGKYVVDDQGKQLFFSFKDIVGKFQNLNYSQRFALVLKSLTDRDGGLTTPENREKLGAILTNALGVQNELVVELLRAACDTADAELIAFPVAQTLAPLLFSSLHEDFVDESSITHTSVRQKDKQQVRLSTEDVGRILQATTRELVSWGARYHEQSDAPLSQIFLESERQYDIVLDKLKLHFSDSSETPVLLGKPDTADVVSSEEEALISTMQRAGALPTRSIQLAAQLGDLRPALRKRFSQAFDANHGMNKLLLWENIYRLSLKDQSVNDFMETRVNRIGEYLGGGSLFTTYESFISDGNSDELDTVVKMLNPNARAFLDKTYQNAMKILDEVEEKTQGKNKQQVRMMRVFADLAYRWCQRDILDPYYEVDDDRFRIVIEGYNSKKGEGNVFAPARRFTHPKLRFEDKVGGVTLNQALSNDDIPDDTKKELIRDKGRFFFYQLHNSSRFEDESGDTYRLVLSDPSIGNTMYSPSNVRELGIIDRNLYLRVKDDDIAVIDKLIQGDEAGFLEKFVDRIFDINKVHNELDRQRISLEIKVDVAREATRQKITGRKDKFSLLNSAVSVLTRKKLDVPLELELLIRNVEAERELYVRYGIEMPGVIT